jgi:hypothetical protein
MRSDIIATSVCYIRSACDISMSLAHISTSSKAAVLVLFSIHVLKLCKRTLTGVTEDHSKSEVRMVVRFLQAEGVSQSEIHHRLESVYGEKVFS